MEGIAKASDVELWWERFGEPGARDVVLHSGAGDSAELFPRSFCETLADGRRCVVRFDPRDAGRSTRTPDDSVYDANAMASDLWAVADSAGVGRAVLIGYSGGGDVVRRAALLGPQRTVGLVLLATFAPPPDLQFSDDGLAQLMAAPAGGDENAPTDFASDKDFWFVNATADDLSEVAARMTPGRAPTARAASRHGTAIMSTAPTAVEELRALTLPVLVLHSTDDRMFPHAQADATARCFPNARVHRVSGIGHIPTERQWLQLAEIILASFVFADG